MHLRELCYYISNVSADDDDDGDDGDDDDDEGGDILGHVGAGLGLIGAIFGHVGAILGLIGAILGHVGAILGLIGAILGQGTSKSKNHEVFFGQSLPRTRFGGPKT